MTNEKQAQKKGFDLERILTISAEAWAQSEGKILSDYEMKGVHYEGRKYSDNWITDIRGFVNSIPESAEVVVCFKDSMTVDKLYYPGAAISDKNYYARGTALIPRKRK